MTIQPLPLARPRHDGQQVLFELRDQGIRITCAISRAALRQLDDVGNAGPMAPLERFMAARGRIEAMALLQHRARAACTRGVLQIGTEDPDNPPDRNAPSIALPARWRLRA